MYQFDYTFDRLTHLHKKSDYGCQLSSKSCRQIQKKKYYNKTNMIATYNIISKLII